MKGIISMSLNQQLDQLATFKPTEFPVISLYLNTQPGQHGRAIIDPFVRKKFNALTKKYARKSLERESIEIDTARIKAYLQDNLET